MCYFLFILLVLLQFSVVTGTSNVLWKLKLNALDAWMIGLITLNYVIKKNNKLFMFILKKNVLFFVFV
jgi:hypothetical protein